MSNPFDFYGPEFLVFYTLLGFFAVAICWCWIRVLETPYHAADIRDPYAIAYLRGGTKEVLRVVLISLIERGFLKLVGSDMVETVSGVALKSVRHPVEQYVLHTCQSTKTVPNLFTATDYPDLLAACEEYRQPLNSAGLMLCGQTFVKRVFPFFVTFGMLAFFAIYKIQVALERGRTNIGFLVILAFIFGAILLFLLLRRRTAAGDIALHSLKNQFEHLKGDVGRHTDDSFKTTMLAAVFGVGVLPALDYPYIQSIFPRAYKTDSTSNSSGCGGSGCAGSSGGSGDGGGGGGCGGGCGGCGG